MVDINIFQVFVPSNSSSPYRSKLTKLLSLTAKKKIGIFFQVILKSDSVSFIEVAAREIVCCGFNFNTKGTKCISCIFKTALNESGSVLLTVLFQMGH